MGVMKDDMIYENEDEVVLEEQEVTELEEVERGLNITTEELVDLVGGFLAYFKAKTVEGQAYFLNVYRARVIPMLKLLGFDKALMEVPIKRLPPEMTLALGFGIMIAVGIFTRVPEDVEAKEQPTFESTFRQPHEERKIEEGEHDDISLRKDRNGKIILGEEADQENKE